MALVCAGKFHDIDFARLELLKLLAEIPNARTTAVADYDFGDELDQFDCLISYTCDVVADREATARLRAWLERGGRWFALHGTNSVIEFVSGKPLKIRTPDVAPEFMQLLGSQFQAHPPICDFDVHPTDDDHELIEGIESFSTNDEIYLCRMHGDPRVLLYCNYDGDMSAFESSDWQANDVQPVMYLNDHDQGSVLYLTLGHCRGHYDMRPLTDYYPDIERCSWETPEYYELLRRGIHWAIGGESADS